MNDNVVSICLGVDINSQSLEDELFEVIYSRSNAHGLTYAQVIGTLEILKTRLYMDSEGEET